MSTDFATQLTTMLDDVAASINPRSDFAEVRTSTIQVSPSTGGTANGGPPFRRWTAIAAAALLAIAGGAMVWATGRGSSDTLSTASETVDHVTDPVEMRQSISAEHVDDTPAVGQHDDARSAPDAGGTPETSDTPGAAIARTASVTEADANSEQVRIVVRGTAPADEVVLVSSLSAVADATADEHGDWQVVLEFAADEGPLARYDIFVSFGSSNGRIALVAEPVIVVEEPKEQPTEQTTEQPKEQPKETPKEEPKPAPVIEFTAHLATTHFELSPPNVVLTGDAQPGAVVTAASDYGSATAITDETGNWEMLLQLVEFGPGARTTVRLTADQTTIVRELVIERPAPEPEPAPIIEFTATYAEGVLTSNPMWQRYNGTGQPGSRVIASSDFGVADVTIGESGTWTVKLWLEGAPAGTDFGVYVSNTESSVVTEFRVQTPTAAPEPPPVEFTATAAWVESAASPAFNEYSGTAQPGTKVLISSPYGSAERVAGEAGNWDARIEFPDAPLGETFVVQVTSVATGTVKELPMKRVEPI